MSYPRDLEDYSDQELTVHLASRLASRSLGKCAYCTRSRTEPAGCDHRNHSSTAESLRKLLKQYGVIE